ncbi:MAG: hypothetical protein EKK61_06550, partial [Rickettsiales bacterium]
MKLIKLVTIVILLFAHTGLIAYGATSTDPNNVNGTNTTDNNGSNGATNTTTTQPNSDDELIAGAEQSTYDWMTASFDTIASFLATCIEVPQFANVVQSNTTVNLEQSGQWVSTGVNVVAGNMLGINWTPKGIVPRPVKYKVLYRIDPRFEKPQVFIQKYDYVTQRYISDFDHFKDGILPRYQSTPEMTFTDRIVDIPGYFNFSGRASIPVQKDDVVNISIIDANKYFGNSSEMNNELGSQDNLVIIYSQSGIDDNKLIYTNAAQFCADAITALRPEYAHNCAQSGLYWDVGDNWKTMQGRILNPALDLSKNNLSSCTDTANGKDNIPLCYYDKGRGIQITVGGTTVKAVNEKFMTSSFTGKDFFYYNSSVNGNLEFQTSWLIDGMYNGYSQFMKDWSETDYTIFQNNLNIAKPSMTMNFLHFGRYFMEIEIGSSVSALTHDDMQAIRLEYIVKEDSLPSDSDVGTSVEQIYKGNAPESGLLFVRAVSNDDSLVGTFEVNFTTYAGSGWFSDLIYTKLIDPLRQNFNILTMTLYQKFVTNIVLHNIARLMLVTYIMLYALMFLAGVTEITVSDIVVRIVKISIVVALFSENSWSFFNGYLFNMFILGIDSFMTQVSGVTSSVGNVFGFIDPIIDRYSNPKLYALLLIQLIQFPLGFTFFAIIVFYSMWIYFKAIMEVIISYCLAFVGMAVMISLAPFFITFILFERTKGMFDNWISSLFSYMIQPTILLVFFLLIDQIVSEQLMQTVMRACWGILIPLSFTIDLNSVGIPINFSFTLPFLPGIPFYIPDIFVSESINDLFAPNGTIMSVASSTFILFSVSKLAGGLVEYVSAIVQSLTQVSMGGRLSSDGKDVNPVKNIMSDMGKIARPGVNAARNAAMSPSKFAKEKIIDQKITHRNKIGGESKINYGQFSAGAGTPKGMNKNTTDSSRSANQGAETAWKAATPK